MDFQRGKSSNYGIGYLTRYNAIGKLDCMSMVIMKQDNIIYVQNPVP